MLLKKYNAEVIDNVITQLLKNHYINDQRYAEVYLENLKMYKTFGFYGIKKKFMEKKLPPEIISQILTDGLSVEEEEKIARRFLKKEGFEVKAKSVDEEITYRGFGYDEDGQRTLNHSFRKRDSGIRARQKTANRLKSRGFRGEVISRIIF